jgi:hypothetical protein
MMEKQEVKMPSHYGQLFDFEGAAGTVSAKWFNAFLSFSGHVILKEVSIN